MQSVAFGEGEGRAFAIMCWNVPAPSQLASSLPWMWGSSLTCLSSPQSGAANVVSSLIKLSSPHMCCETGQREVSQRAVMKKQCFLGLLQF